METVAVKHQKNKNVLSIPSVLKPYDTFVIWYIDINSHISVFSPVLN